MKLKEAINKNKWRIMSFIFSILFGITFFALGFNLERLAQFFTILTTKLWEYKPR